MNWLANPKGVPGHFIELDLLQEHSNFWLEDLAQHKGKEFDEPFYREVLSMNVIDFLRLKDEMEEAVVLKRRSKKHGEPHLDTELRTVMDSLREEEVNCFRQGRDEGFDPIDDFSTGMDDLDQRKIKDFIAKSTIFSNISKLHTADARPENILSDIEEEMEQMDQSDELDDDGSNVPHHPMFTANGDIYMVEPSE
ncbi:hypothetical protein GALMADRAFT_149230 [Galerina marginata CBS 339.88]|nr:hypothetical protein GALMADRAFT_149230 [Galerina marginata CBS 339.88]